MGDDFLGGPMVKNLKLIGKKVQDKACDYGKFLDFGFGCAVGALG